MNLFLGPGKEFERMLERHHGIRYERWNAYLPKLDALYFKNQEKALALFAKLADYYSYPLVFDRFSSHDERRAWRDKMHERYGNAFVAAYERNALRGNKIASFYGFVQLLEAWYAGSSPQVKLAFHGIRHIIKTRAWSDIYALLSVEEKRRVVHDLKHALRDLFIACKTEEDAASYAARLAAE